MMDQKEPIVPDRICPPDIGPTHPDTHAIVDFFREKASGDRVPYERLEELVGYSVRPGSGRGYGRMQSARRILSREHGVELQVIVGVGFQVATSKQITAAIEGQLRATRRKARKALSTARNVDVSQLADEDRTHFLANVSQFAVIHHVSAAKATKRLECEITEKSLPVQKTLEAFRKT